MKLLSQATPSCACSLGHEFLLSGDHGLDSVVHILDEVLLGATETSSVGDIEDSVGHVGGLSTGSTDLHVVLLGDGSESVHILGEVWKSDVDGGTEGSSEVGWA